MLFNETQSISSILARQAVTRNTGFGYRLASLRTQRRISSWDFAALLQIPLVQLDRMERGDDEVDNDLLEAVAELFGMPVQKLLLGL